MEPEEYSFDRPERTEWRLPDNSVLDGPAIVRHRIGVPAVITPFGYSAWYQNGLRHRIGGPAIEYEAFQAWYESGLAHRVGGPAKVFSDWSVQYWENGVRIK